SGRRLRWPRSQGREARRSAGPAVLEVRARHQQPDRTHARADRARQAARCRRRGDRMRRRQFITLLSGAAAWPLAARAQQGERMRRVGILMAYPESDAAYQGYVMAFREELQKLGWQEGRNVRFDYRWATSDLELIKRSAKELIALQPDLILCSSTPSTASLLQQTQTIPII